MGRVSTTTTSKIFFLGCIYFGAAKLGLSWAYVSASASAIWPTGLAFAALLIFGLRLWPGIFIGALLVNWSNVGNAVTSLAIATGNTLEAVLGAWLIQRWANGVEAFESVKTILRFVVCVMVSTAVSATIGVTSLDLGGFGLWKNYGLVWLTWWLGDLVNGLIVAPVLLLWFAQGKARFGVASMLTGLGFMGVVALVGIFIFGGWLNYPMTYLSILPLLWGAYYFSQRVAVAATLVLSTVATVGTMRGVGPFASADSNDSLLLLLFFMGTISLTALVLSSLICERKKLEEKLHTMAQLPEESPNPVLRLSADKKVLYANRCGAELLDGLARRPEGDYELWAIAQATLRSGAQNVVDIKGAEGRIYSFSCVPLNDKGYVNFYGRDITRRYRAEEALKESEGRFRTLTDALPIMIWQSGTDKRCNYFNKEWLEFTGRTMEEELAENGWAGGVHPEDYERCLSIYVTAFDRHEIFEMEYRLRHHSGEYRWVLERGQPWLSPSGRFLGYLGGCVDITQRRETEKALARATARFKGVITSAMDAIISVDADHKIILFNPFSEKMFGISASEAMGKPIHALLPEQFKTAHSEHVLHFGETGVSARQMGELGKVVGLRADGVEFPVEASISQVEVGGEKIFTVILRDNTQRMIAEEHQSLLAAIVESSEDAIFSKKLDGTISTWNRGAERLMGYQAWEIVGLPIQRLIPPELWDEEKDRMERVSRGERVQGNETIRVRKDGRRLNVSLTLSPFYGPKGAIIGVSTIMHDITHRKRTEEQLWRATEQLAHANQNLEKTVQERTAKLKETILDLEGFSYSLSHDMRAPLRAIESYAQIVLADYGAQISSPGDEYLAKIINSAERLDRLIQDVLTLSRVSQQELVMGPINVEKLLWNIIRERPELQDPRAQINIESPILMVQGHEASLTQCITNLLGNAIKFVTRGVKPQVRIWAEPKDNLVRLWFEDNGIGIDKEEQQRLFRIFERIRGGQEYEGTGIGLAIVRKAAERMGGQVGVESELGKGSRFWLQLARAEDSTIK